MHWLQDSVLVDSRPKRSNRPLRLPHRCPSCWFPADPRPRSRTLWPPPQWDGSGWFRRSCCLRLSPGLLAVGNLYRFSKEGKDAVMREISSPWREGQGTRQAWGWEYWPQLSVTLHALSHEKPPCSDFTCTENWDLLNDRKWEMVTG